MPTTTQLREYPGAQVGHVVLFDGIEIGLTDRRELVGIDTGSGHSVQLGLQRSGLSYRMAIDIRTGEVLQSPATLPIDDFDDSIGDLFKAASTSEQALVDVPFGAGTAIAPSEDLSPRTELHGRHVGLERISSSGARHQFPVPTDASDTWGMQHTIALDGAGTESAPVSEDPIVWSGRRVELRRVYFDLDGTPRPWSESRRLWMGTLRDDGMPRGRRWTIEAAGPESLLQKPLALGWQREPVSAVSDLDLDATSDERETGFGVRLVIPYGGGGGDYSLDLFASDLTGANAIELRDEIRARIELAAADATGDGPFDEIAGCAVSMDAQGRVRIATTTTSNLPAILQLCLHRKVWAALGYEVEIQRQLEPPDAVAVRFDPIGADAFAASAPGGDYWVGTFFTGTEDTTIYPNGANNGGATRVYSPLYPAGTQTLLADLNGGRGQVVRLGDANLGSDTSQSTIAHPGQAARPIASDPTDPTAPIEIDGVPCTRTGFWLFFGVRRYVGGGDGVPNYAVGIDEVFDEVWVGEASWVGGAGQQAGLVSGDRIIVTKWWEPGLFGFASKGGITSDWVARVSTGDPEDGSVRAVPIAVSSYSDGFDEAHKVLLRTLLTTGTSAGWSSYAADGAATLAAGENEPSEAPSLRCDAEVAPLGLAIPADWVAAPSEFDAVAEQVANSDVLKVKAAYSAAYPAGDLLRSLMQPLGWCWHLRDGAFGIWCPADGLTIYDATLVIDRSVRGEIGSGRFTHPNQSLRYLQPIDRWKFQTNLRPHFGGTTLLERTSLDRGFAYRPGTVQQDVLAHHMRRPEGIYARLQTLSAWWARRHFPVSGYPISILEAERAWPGTIVRLTDSELVDPRGYYGVVNRLAVVTALRVDLADGMRGNGGTASVDLLVFDDSAATPRYHAPVAVCIGYDSATQRLITAPEGLGAVGGGALFVEPQVDGVVPFGGDAVIECWQWDGSTWAQTCSGTVDSAAAGYVQLTGPITGTYYRDRDTIGVLRPTATANAAWVDAIFSPISSGTNGQWTDVATPTDGYPWET